MLNSLLINHTDCIIKSMDKVKERKQQLNDYDWFKAQVDSGKTVMTFLEENPEITRSVLKYHEKKHGLKLKRGDRQERWDKYYAELEATEGPHKFFDVIDSHEKAYILGLIVSDGNIYKGKVSIALHKQDGYMLEKIKDLIGLGNIYDRKGYFLLEIWNNYMCKSFINLGVTPNKSMTASIPEVPKELQPHLLRGIWDGDGYIKPKGKVSCVVTGSELMSKQLSKIIFEITGHEPNIGMVGQVNKSFRLNLTTRQWKFMEYMYGEEGLVLSRKKERFLSSLNEGGEVEIKSSTITN